MSFWVTADGTCPLGSKTAHCVPSSVERSTKAKQRRSAT